MQKNIMKILHYFGTSGTFYFGNDVVTSKDGVHVWRYYATDIVKLETKGTDVVLTISLNGYDTVTTMRRINAALDEWRTGCRAYHKDSVLMLSYQRQPDGLHVAEPWTGEVKISWNRESAIPTVEILPRA